MTEQDDREPVLFTPSDVGAFRMVPSYTTRDVLMGIIEVPKNIEEKERGITIQAGDLAVFEIRSGRGIDTKFFPLFPKREFLDLDSHWTPKVKRPHPFAKFKGGR